MPLHDWDETAGWEGVHHFWITELVRWLQPRLPAPYRAYVGSTPTISFDALEQRPDIGVRRWQNGEGPPGPAPAEQPDFTGTLLVELDPQMAVHVRRHGRLVAAIELISPRNKDRPEARDQYLARCRNYLADGAHLLLVDVHRRPLTFSFADSLATAVGEPRPPLPSPHAVSCRVGDIPPEGGRPVAVWRRALAVGEELPPMPLHLTMDDAVVVDLESTYMEGAALAYIG